MRNKSFRIVVSVLSLICLVSVQRCFSQLNLSDKVATDPDVLTGKLANGLVYYIRNNKIPEKKVQLRLVVNAGSVLEDADQRGLAHFMEHMNFNGLQHFPRNELVNYLQSIGVQFGADLNAYTSFDETVFILPIPSDDSTKVEQGFTILEDWAAHALLDTTEINKERGVVLEESRLGKGANERMQKVYFPKLFNGSLYAERLPIGKDSIIQNFQAPSIRRFYNTWYRPDLQAVVVVGDIDPAVALAEIKKHFGGLSNPVSEKPRPSIIDIPARKTSEGMVLTDKEQTNTILQLINFVEKNQPTVTWADYRKGIVEGLFSALINQRLAELAQQADPPFLFANTGYSPLLRGYRAFTSFAVIGDKSSKMAIDALVNTTESVKKNGFLQTELDRAKKSLLNQAEEAFTNKDKTQSARLVQDYINNFLSSSPIPGIANRYNFLKQVLPGISLQEVNALAAGTENGQGKFVLLTAPEKKAGLPSGQELLAMVESARSMPVKAYEEKTIAKTLVDKAPKPGKIIAETTNAKLGTTDLVFSNGITVTLKTTDFKNDEIQMDAWRWGGYHNYPIADKQNAQNAPGLIGVMGVKDMNPVDLRKFLAGKTVSVTPYMNPNEDGIQGSSSVKDLETFFQLLNLYFTAPRKDTALARSWINTQKGFLQNLKANPNFYFLDSLSKIEYGNNPWASGAFPSPDDFNKINIDRAWTIYNSVYGNADGMHFTFVGNLDPNTIKPLLAVWLGSLPSSPKEHKFTDVGIRPVRGVVKAPIYKGLDKKSLVIISFAGEAPYSREESLKLKVLTDALTIRAIEQLREEMSGVYTINISSSFAKRPYNNYSINASFPCAPENVDTLTKAFFAIVAHAQDSGVSQVNLDKVKEKLLKADLDGLKQNDHWLSDLSESWIDKEDPAWILDYAKAVSALKAEDLHVAAKKYFDMKNYVVAVLNPEKK
jgi:zinc protease